MPSPRRILSLWFPHLAAERVLRQERGTLIGPFAIVATQSNTQTLVSLSIEAEAEGLYPGQALRDARAFCPALLTRPANPPAEAAFLHRLARWAGKFTPLVAKERPDALVLDITGCAHLFGGEAGLALSVQADCARLHLSVRIGLADTPGAAWALARYAGQAAPNLRSGDTIDQEARATRARAIRRHQNHSAPTRHLTLAGERTPLCIAPPGQTRAAIAPLPVAALRLPETVALNIQRLGVQRIGELAVLPRAPLARRFGRDVLKRLDQALGAEPEPISPARAEIVFATRLSLPEPIGLDTDIMAAIERLLPPLCTRLKTHGQGARRLRLWLFRADHSCQRIEAGLARPSHDPGQIRPLLALKLTEVDPGFGIDVIRLEASATEALHPTQHAGPKAALLSAQTRAADETALDNLITRLGARIGLEAITRLHPADSHIPEKTATVMGAAWTDPAPDWCAPKNPRPLVLFPPEIVTAPDVPRPPDSFRWRQYGFQNQNASGPERIAPEWWLDDPDWRTGTRDYWRIETRQGIRLWLFYAYGGLKSGGWFCQGVFA